MPSRDRRPSPRVGGRGQARPHIESLEIRSLLTGPAATVPVEVTTVTATVTTPAPADTGTVTTTAASTVTPATPAAVTPATPAADTATTTTTPTSTPTTPTPRPATPPDLIAARLANPTNLDWDQDFRLEGSIQNQGGSAAASGFRVDVFASPTTKTTKDSVPIGSFVVPGGLAAGSKYDFDVPLRTPGKPTASLAGKPSYYLTLKVDAANAVAESNEANNEDLGLQGVDASAVTVTPRLPAKLVAAGISVAPGQADWGGSINVTTTVRNDGPGKAPPTNNRIVLSPFGDDPLGPRSYTIGFVPMPEIQPYQTVTASQQIDLPDLPPTVLSNVGKFNLLMVSDADGLTDPVIKPKGYQGIGLDWTTLNMTPKAASNSPDQLPDLAVTALTTPAAMAWDQTIELKATLENAGKTDAGPFKVRFGLVQSDAPDAPMLALADAFIPGLGAGRVQEVLQTIKLPATPPAGINVNAPAGRIVARIDPDRTLDEVRTDNNRIASPPITLRLVKPDGTTGPAVTVTASPTPGTPTPAPVGTTTPPIAQNPGTGASSARPQATRAVILKMRRQQRIDRAHAQAAARKPNLRIYPRVQNPVTPARAVALARGKVRIMPVASNTQGAASPDRPA